jgi:pimeloyl-ACP methyl ester carboxylesterase
MLDSMGSPATGFVRSLGRHGFHRVAYREWGHASQETVMCVHGLTRNNRDFDPLAAALSTRFHVVCPDLVGRGASDWLTDPSDYHLAQYNIDLTVLCARFGLEQVDWVGTSLGALCGMSLAGIENSPIRRLVVNDIAPDVPMAAIRRVSRYLSVRYRFQNLEEVEAHLRETYEGFGPMADADWRRMARTSAVTAEDGGLRLRFDPEVGRNFRNYWLLTHFHLWKFWDRIRCPILILRGTNSDFLTDPLLEQMVRRQPEAKVIEFNGIGHVPTLNVPEQIDPVVAWLETR